MNQCKKAFIVLLLFTLCVPIVSAVTIDGPTNFVSSHGGIVRYANAVVSAQVGIVNAITRFNTLVVGGVNRGNLAFDCDDAVVMVITGVTGNTVQYTITAVGQVDSYVYFGNRLYEPVGTNTDAVVYDAVTGITTVTTTGNVAVTLTYTAPAAAGGADEFGLVNLINAFVLITIVSIFLYVSGSKIGISSEVLFNIVVLIAFLAMIAYLAVGWGF